MFSLLCLFTENGKICLGLSKGFFMALIDIILFGFIVFGIVRGFMKGLFIEVASIVALIAGIYGAIHFSNFAAEYLQDKVSWNEKTMNIAAFTITFVVIILVIALAGKALTKLADFAALGMLNKLLGAVFGGLKTTLILSVLLIILEKLNAQILFTDKKDLEESALYKPVKSLVPSILPSILNDEKPIEEDSEFNQKTEGTNSLTRLYN